MLLWLHPYWIGFIIVCLFLCFSSNATLFAFTQTICNYFVLIIAMVGQNKLLQQKLRAMKNKISKMNVMKQQWNQKKNKIKIDQRTQ